jgi:hypothetical protein
VEAEFLTTFIFFISGFCSTLFALLLLKTIFFLCLLSLELRNTNSEFETYSPVIRLTQVKLIFTYLTLVHRGQNIDIPQEGLSNNIKHKKQP